MASADVIPLLEELLSGIEGLGERSRLAAAEESSKVVCEIANLRTVLSERGVSEDAAEIANLRTVLNERNVKIAGLQNSLSWHLTAPLSSAYDAWLRVFGRKDE